MKNNKNIPEENFSAVQALIQKEEETAAALFQQQDFDARIKERIRAESKKKIIFPGWLRFPSPIPALGAALLVLLIAVSLIFHLFSPSTAEEEFQQLKNYFAQIRVHSSEPADEEENLTIRSPEYTALEQTFKRTLYSVYLRNENISESHLAGIFNKVLFNVPLPDEDIARLSEGIPPDPQILEKRIQIMIKKKQVYHTLTNVMKET
jgi:hypothetical protein